MRNETLPAKEGEPGRFAEPIRLGSPRARHGFSRWAEEMDGAVLCVMGKARSLGRIQWAEGGMDSAVLRAAGKARSFGRFRVEQSRFFYK